MQISKLAIEGGAPVREKILPYGRQTIHPDDTRAVIAALSSDWLTTGPEVAAFEADFARITRSEHAIAVNSGTAAQECTAIPKFWFPHSRSPPRLMRQYIAGDGQFFATWIRTPFSLIQQMWSGN
jgi:hypothetical protein